MQDQDPHGQVVSVHTDSAGSHAMVDVDASVICARCAAGKGCGAGLLAGAAQTKRVNAVVTRELRLSDGDLVRISLRPRNVLRAALIVYGYPLAGVVLGAVAAFAMGRGDATAAFAALLGLVAGFLTAKVSVRDVRCLQEFTPVVLEKLSADVGPAAV